MLINLRFKIEFKSISISILFFISRHLEAFACLFTVSIFLFYFYSHLFYISVDNITINHIRQLTNPTTLLIKTLIIEKVKFYVSGCHY